MNPSSGRVPLHKVTDLRERGLDVLGGAAANGAVRLDNAGPRGGAAIASVSESSASDTSSLRLPR